MTPEQIALKHQELKNKLENARWLAGFLLEKGTNAYFAFYSDEVKALSDFEEKHDLKDKTRLF